jgi:hypothetical protein
LGIQQIAHLSRLGGRPDITGRAVQ